MPNVAGGTWTLECHVPASQDHFSGPIDVSRPKDPSFRRNRATCLTRSSESTKKRIVNLRNALHVLALLTATSPLYAQASKDEWDGGFNGPKAKRRADLVIGLRVAPALGWVRGYPNEASKIDDPRYLSNTHTGWGSDNGFWIGGALRDWFTFAIGAEGIGVKRKTLTASGGIFTLRTEIYPAWSLGCGWRDLGVAMDFGLGGMKMSRNGAPRADGGSIGAAGIEVFHESLRWHGFAFGPALGYRQLFSSSLTANVSYLGLRAVFYTGP